MRTSLLAGTAIVAISIASPGLAQKPGQEPKATEVSQCETQLDKTRERLEKDEKFKAWYRENPQGRRAYVELIQAARVFAENKMEKRCMEVVQGINDLAKKNVAEAPQGDPDKEKSAQRDQDPRKQDTAQPKSKDDQKTNQPQDRTRVESDPNRQSDPQQRNRAPSDAEQKRAERDRQMIERLKSAKPIDQVQVSAEGLTGADLRNQQNKDLGDVEDLLMENGQVQAVIIARGGFLGLGQANYKLEAKEVKVVEGEKVIVVIDADEETLKAKAKVKKDKGRWVAQAEQPNRQDRGARPPAKRGDEGRQPAPSQPPNEAPQTQPNE